MQNAAAVAACGSRVRARRTFQSACRHGRAERERECVERASSRVPTRRPSRRGSAATPRASERRAAARLVRLLDRQNRPAHERRRRGSGPARAAAAAAALPRAAGATTRRPSAEHERGEDLSAEPARADAVARVAGAVVDPRAGHGREERQLVARDVDRPAPRPLDLRGGEPGQQPAEALLGAGDCRRVVEEARVDPARPADRPGAGAHQHPPVRGRPEVVEEHPPVGDRLAARPADLLEQLRHGLGEHDVAAERRQPRGAPGASRESHAFVATTISGHGAAAVPSRPRRRGST